MTVNYARRTFIVDADSLRVLKICAAANGHNVNALVNAEVKKLADRLQKKMDNAKATKERS
jgi:hypothetical protein